jgi:hypothetical protein
MRWVVQPVDQFLHKAPSAAWEPLTDRRALQRFSFGNEVIDFVEDLEFQTENSSGALFVISSTVDTVGEFKRVGDNVRIPRFARSRP